MGVGVDRYRIIGPVLRRMRVRWIVPIAAIPVVYWLATAKDPEGNPRQARPWQVKAYSTLPLKAMSRLWGQFNGVTLPVWLRAPSYKLYSYIFGVNLDEMADPDLTHYRNLGEFFYRELKPGVRPISDALVTAPSDGKMIQFGALIGDRIEQVKGVSYSIQTFFGIPQGAPDRIRRSRSPSPGAIGKGDDPHSEHQKGKVDLERHAEFADLNGIAYTVDDIVGGQDSHREQTAHLGDASAKKNISDSSVKDIWLPDEDSLAANPDRRLYYAVIYLAPGDYHRFHSPVNWVAQLRRYFVGELFSVAPYFQNRLGNLFCLNERVALLGKWQYGFFSMTPVGATNVGSITINFDKYLRTNTRWITDSDDLESRVRARKTDCYEATYAAASPLLKGHPLHKGDEMGGFHLGSTVVLVFEAPRNFEFVVKKNETVRMGQPLGRLCEAR